MEHLRWKVSSSSRTMVKTRDPPFGETMTTFKPWSSKSDAAQANNSRFEDGTE
jgi:hypothetical protein